MDGLHLQMSQSTATGPAFTLHRMRAPYAIRFTRDAVAQMQQILPGKYELVEGELIDKMSQRLPHRIAMMALLNWMIQTWGHRFLQDQASIDVSPEDNPTSEPQPDAVALNIPLASLQGNPQPGQIELVIEVSDSSAAYDLTTKAGLYARAGIGEYWVLDIPRRLIHVHRDPVEGVYRAVVAHLPEQSVAPLAKPGAALAIADLLPPQS